MSSIEPEEKKSEVDSGVSSSTEKQPEIPPPENTDNTDSVSVKVETPGSGSEQPAEPKRGSFLTCYIPIPKPLHNLILCLLFVCFTPVAYALISVATVAVLPLLIGAFVVVRLVQFFVRDADIEKLFTFKFLLRYWIFVVVLLLLVELGIFYPIAKHVPGLKLATIIGLSITKWIKIICILIGIYLISQVVWVSILFIIIQIISDEDEKGFVLLESTSEIIDCLLFLWAEVVVMSSVPTFEQSKIFGIYTQQWFKVSLLLLIGYNIITFLTHTIVWSLPKLGDHLGVGDALSSVLSAVCCDDIGKGAFSKKYVVYVASGIKRSIIFILSMVMLLITWTVYFSNHLGSTSQDKQVLKYGTWTMVSILVCSFLWLFKSCVLLYWEAHTVYDRLHSKVTDIGKQLYFLILLSYTQYLKLIESPDVESDDTDCGSSCSKTPPKKKAQWVLLATNAEGEECQMLDRKSVRTELINHTGPKASTYDIQKAAQRFLAAQYALSKESIVGDLHHLQSTDNSGEDNAKCIEILKKVVEVEGESYFEKDWEMLLKLLPDVKTTEEITFQKVKIMMERAHSRCMFLTNTLISENEVVKCLNQVISAIIIAVTGLMWLLLTGLAKTNVLVLIASPLLAATFIFGDTAKLLFQGLIFVYIVHPFDVGDLCVIDNKLLEVRRIGIWCTTFSKVRTIGKQQEIIYPNSVLALKNVVNYKTDFDWNDEIEFVCSPDKKITEPLKRKIETYLNDEKEKFTPNFHSVDILEIGDKAKIVVHFKHKLPTTEGWTYFECLKEKERRRFEFAIYVQNLVKELESAAETPESSAQLEHDLTTG